MSEGSPFLVKKLVAIAFVILGFLLLATGNRYGSFGTMAGGSLLLLFGVIILIMKIVRRNERS